MIALYIICGYLLMGIITGGSVRAALIETDGLEFMNVQKDESEATFAGIAFGVFWPLCLPFLLMVGFSKIVSWIFREANNPKENV